MVKFLQWNIHILIKICARWNYTSYTCILILWHKSHDLFTSFTTTKYLLYSNALWSDWLKKGSCKTSKNLTHQCKLQQRYPKLYRRILNTEVSILFGTRKICSDIWPKLIPHVWICMGRPRKLSSTSNDELSFIFSFDFVCLYSLLMHFATLH